MDGDRQMTKWKTEEGERGEGWKGEGRKDKVLFVHNGLKRPAAARV